MEIGDDLIAWSPDRSHLVGSTAVMPQMAARMRTALGLDGEQIERLLYHNPRRALLGDADRG